MKWLADLVVRVKDWPLIPQLALRLWFGLGLVWLIDTVFSLGLFAIFSSWMSYLCAAPILLILVLALFDLVNGWGRKLAILVKASTLMADTPTIPNVAEASATAKILPGTGRGTAKRWRGRLKPVSVLSELNLARSGPSVAPRHLPVPERILVGALHG